MSAPWPCWCRRSWIGNIDCGVAALEHDGLVVFGAGSTEPQRLLIKFGGHARSLTASVVTASVSCSIAFLLSFPSCKEPGHQCRNHPNPTQMGRRRERPDWFRWPHQVCIRGRMRNTQHLVRRIFQFGRSAAVSPVTPRRAAPHRSFSYRSLWSVLSASSVLSVASAASLLSVGSFASILSIGSSNSVLSIGSDGGFLSIGRSPRSRSSTSGRAR